MAVTVTKGSLRKCLVISVFFILHLQCICCQQQTENITEISTGNNTNSSTELIDDQDLKSKISTMAIKLKESSDSKKETEPTTDSTTPTTTDTTTELVTTTEDPIGTTVETNMMSGTISSKGYPKPYKYDKVEIYTIPIEKGYVLHIFLEDLDLNGLAHDYLVIKSGYSWESGGTGMIFTWNINSKRNFTILNSDAAYIKFVSQKRDDPTEPNKYKGFKLDWEKTGELSTTTLSPSTVEPLPSQSDDSITVYLFGQKPDVFAKNIHQFESLLVNMATVYCQEKNIPLAKEIVTSNIIIKLVTYCPLNWPDFDQCIKVEFAIPVFLDESYQESYELTPKHLQEMWELHKRSLKDLDLDEYNQPSFKNSMIAWLAFGLGALIMFVIFLYILWKMDFFADKPGMRRLSESESIITEKGRVSDGSLFPSPHQLVPPLFESQANGLSNDSTRLADRSALNRHSSCEPDWRFFNSSVASSSLYASTPRSPQVEQPTFNPEPSYDNRGYVDDEVIILRRAHPTEQRSRKFISLTEEPQGDSIL